MVSGDSDACAAGGGDSTTGAEGTALSEVSELTAVVGATGELCPLVCVGLAAELSLLPPVSEGGMELPTTEASPAGLVSSTNPTDLPVTMGRSLVRSVAESALGASTIAGATLGAY
jgi:hypothetical protein